MNGKTGVPGGKPTSQMQCKPYDINLDEGFTATKAQENNKRERERRTHTLTCVYIYDLVPKGAHARGYALQLKIKHC